MSLKLKHRLNVERCDLQQAQAIIKKNHYLKSLVSFRARPFAYQIALDGKIAGYAILGIPNFIKRKNLFGYEGLPTHWQVLVLYRFWIDPTFQISLNNGHKFCIASCAIAKILKRVNADWLLHHPPRYPELPYEIELILAYTDPSQGHLGTIYKASNFQLWGETTNSNGDRSRRGDTLPHKSSKKLLYIYRLSSSRSLQPDWENYPMQTITIPKKFAQDLLKIARIWDNNSCRS